MLDLLRRSRLFALSLGLWLAGAAGAWAEPVGSVELVQGKVSVRNGSTATAAKAGTVIAKGDRVLTEQNARAVLKLLDGTSMILGENAELAIDDYVFVKSSGLALVELAKGALRFATGKIGKLQDKRIEVRTPAATLAARGTEFWVGPIDGGTGVLLLKGQVDVRNPAGSVLLAGRRQGTQVKDRGTSPEPAKTWPDAKYRRALAATTLH